MPNVTTEELQQFDKKLRACYRRIGGGKVAMDSDAIRNAVRSHRDAAHRYVEIHCTMAASQPGYLQPAMIVAATYQVEFNDDSLFSMVHRRAKELNAWEELERIGFSPRGEKPQGEPREREAARQWWKTSSKESGMCDDCRLPLSRGEGYLVDGRVMLMGDQKINVGLELLCQQCFETGKKSRTIP